MFLKSSLVFAIYTMISRIFGLVRDLMVASAFGATLYADAFNVAFKLPNFFRSIFAEGAFSSAFVPLFSGKFAREGREKSLEFASNALIMLSLVVFALVALFEIIMPLVIMVLAPGFEVDPFKLELTIYLTRITTPYLFFITLVTFLSCVLSGFGKFASQAASPIILNLAMIVALYFFKSESSLSAIALAWGVVAGGALQLLAIYVSVLRKGVKFTIKKPKLDDDLKRLLKNMWPAVIGSGVSQINLWIGTIIATTIPGAVSLIYYADRITQLPLALIGVSIGIVILPTLSKQVKSGKMDQYVETQNRAIEISLFLSLPCTVALLAMSKPVIYVLFQHGMFTASNTEATAMALITLSLGIPAYILNKIMIPSFFAVEDTKTPVRVSTLCVVLNIVLNLILVRYFAHVGITISTALVAWVNIIALMYLAIRKKLFVFDGLIRNKINRLILCAGIMYIYMVNMLGILHKYMFMESKLYSISSLVFMVLSSALVYFIAIFTTGTYTLQEIKGHYNARQE